MYFLWKNTRYGTIRISSGGLYEFINSTLKSRLRLYSITLSPSGRKNDDADLSIVLSEDDLIPETRKIIESHLKSVMKPLGIISTVIWAAPENWLSSLLRSTWTWAGVASCFTIIITAGFEGFFWTLFWGSAAWFIVKGFAFITNKIWSA